MISSSFADCGTVIRGGEGRPVTTFGRRLDEISLLLEYSRLKLQSNLTPSTVLFFIALIVDVASSYVEK